MRHLLKGAAQRQVAKHPHKPSSQALGARYLPRQNWRKAASLDRRTQTLTAPAGPMTGGTWVSGGQVISAGDPAPPADMLIVDEYPQPLATIRPPLSTIRTRCYRPSSGRHAYAPRR